MIEYETTKYWTYSLVDAFKPLQQLMFDAKFAGNVERSVINKLGDKKEDQR